MRKTRIARFAKDTSGAVFIYTAFAATVLLALAALSVDLGYWYTAKRSMQSAADGAAMAGALEIVRGSSTADAQARAAAIAVDNGYDVGAVTINIPPQNGPNKNVAGFVEAIVQEPTTGFLSKFTAGDSVNISARAVATTIGSPACIYALDPDDSGALTITGNTDVTLGCGAQVNSNHGTAVTQSGSSCFTATSITTAGGSSSGGCLNPTPTTQPAAPDPFAYLGYPSGGCLHTTEQIFPSSFSGTIPLGNYCGGLSLSGPDATFASGLYIIGGTGLQITGNATITGTDVTFFFQETTTGKSGRYLHIAGTTETTLSAPTDPSDPYKGVLFFAHRGLDPSLDATLLGGADMSLTGAVYLYPTHVRISGNSGTASGEWLAVISNTVQFSGDSVLNANGFNFGDLPLALSSPTLSE